MDGGETDNNALQAKFGIWPLAWKWQKEQIREKEKNSDNKFLETLKKTISCPESQAKKPIFTSKKVTKKGG